MSLSAYNKKRNFSKTPEPAGKQTKKKNALLFVVQKHDASSLHYDFRLQMEGVLKSWAVPKGPSLNPHDKRLAMLVEDHPFDYRSFEGSIPEGNYGAGTVIVWDEGTYGLLDGEGLNIKEQEARLLEDLKRGRLKIKLSGKKLRGGFALFAVKRDAAGKQWLLVKNNDEWATDKDVTTQDASVLSGKTIAQVAAQHGLKPNHPEGGTKKAATTKATAPKKAPVKKVAETKKSAVKKTKGKRNISTSGLQLDWQAEKDQEVTIDAQELKLTNLNKPYWKREGIAKGDMINYYLRVAPYMLPYLLDRPHSLNRHPNGVGGANFYQKNVEGKVPDWVQKHEDFSESTNVAVQYMVCASEASLIYMANFMDMPANAPADGNENYQDEEEKRSRKDYRDDSMIEETKD